MLVESESIFGLALTTYRDKDLSPDSIAFFQYEGIIAAIAIFFCRQTIYSHSKEPFLLRLFLPYVWGFWHFGESPTRLFVLSKSSPIWSHGA